jgi:class 3 adenylate cyclase/tetratricopeptide (TPR) repeat protein
MRCGKAVTLDAGSALEARKVVSVLFCDLVGSTAAGERLDPEDVSEVLRLYHHTARSIVEDFGGVVEKFIGDAVFAVFGVPIVHEDDAGRAVRAALAICDAAAGLPGLGRDALHVRCGVTTGETLVRIRVDYGSGEGFIVGSAANLAARLQGLAPVDGVAVDEQTFNLTQGVFEYTELDPTTVKGKAEPLKIFHPRAPLLPVGAKVRLELSLPLVDREAELRALTAAYDEVVATGRAALVTISGEPGLGKTRLVDALREHVLAKDPSPVWRIGRSLPYGDGVGVWAFAEILKSHAGILEVDDAATALAKLDAMLSDDPDRSWLTQRLLPILGLSSSSSADREESFAAYRRFIELLARDRPAVVVFEDVQWADDALLAFLAHVVNSPGAVPFLVVATTRPELLEQGEASVEAIGRRVVHFTPLSDDYTVSLVASLLDGATLSPELEETILRSAGGNALYAGEFVRLLLDRGVLVRDDGVWRIVEGEVITVPGSTQALIAARLDILPSAERIVLGNAAVVGDTFWAGALAAMGSRPVTEVLGALEHLSRRRLVDFVPEPSIGHETELRFAHALVRDGAYAQLTRRDRADKHQAVARWIEETSGDRLADHVDILAYHACAALDHWPAREAPPDALRASALRYSTLAAERNIALDTRAAALHLERALLLSEEDGPGHTKLLALAGQIALHEGKSDVAADLLERAVAAFREQGDLRAAARTMIPLSWVYVHLGRNFREVVDEAVALIEDGPSCVELLDALESQCGGRTVGGDPRGGLVSAERAFAVAEELGMERPTTALGYRGLARFYLGDMDGVEDVREAASLGASRGVGRDAAVAHWNLAVLEHLVHGPRASLEGYDRMLDFSRRRGLAEMVTNARVFALEPMLDLGRLEELIVLAGELAEHAVEAKSTYLLVYTRSALLRTWAHLGDHARVDETAQWVEVASRRTGAPEDLVVGLAACAIARSVIGHLEAARALTAELVAARAGSVYLFAPRLPGLVRAAASAGDVDLVARVIDSAIHPSPYMRASVAAARGVFAELDDDPAAAASSYADGAQRFATLGVPLEQWLALLGVERSLTATGDRSGAGQAASAAREVRASMPSSGLLVAPGPEFSGPPQPGA